jgi:phosphonopyruvate decarboxylase
MLETVEPAFLEIKCRRGARPDLGRPDIAPTESKRAFMQFLQRSGH